MITSFLFYLFASATLASAVMVIGSANPIHSILFLVLAFVNGAGLLLLVGAEFLGFLFLIVYVGAIAVLFLFVVRRLPAHGKRERGQDVAGYLPIGGLVGASVALELFYVLPSGKGNTPLLESESTVIWAQAADRLNNVEALAHILYDDFLAPFLLAGMILLVARIGAIVLTRHRRGDVKRQAISDQVGTVLNTTVVLKTTA
jgi:NADH-quinone oxidoreductase subunit J